jgi:hypothetical protein
MIRTLYMRLTTAVYKMSMTVHIDNLARKIQYIPGNFLLFRNQVESTTQLIDNRKNIMLI